MSTQYKVYEKIGAAGKVTIEVDERSSNFDIVMVERSSFKRAEIDTAMTGRLTAEELVEVAVKMIQPALYNVEDPGLFFDNVIMKKIKELHVDR